MAFDFAATMTAMAITSLAGVMAIEDLRDLETRGQGRVHDDSNGAVKAAGRKSYFLASPIGENRSATRDRSDRGLLW